MMIDIYLNPEQQLYFSEEQNESCVHSIEIDNLTAAENLTVELKNITQPNN